MFADRICYARKTISHILKVGSAFKTVRIFYFKIKKSRDKLLNSAKYHPLLLRTKL